MTGRGRPRHDRNDEDPLDVVQSLDDAALDTAEGDDPDSDPGEELRDPLEGLTAKGVINPAAGPRVVFVDRERQSLVFSSMVDFIRVARELAAAGVELYE